MDNLPYFNSYNDDACGGAVMINGFIPVAEETTAPVEKLNPPCLETVL